MKKYIPLLVRQMFEVSKERVPKTYKSRQKSSKNTFFSLQSEDLLNFLAERFGYVKKMYYFCSVKYWKSIKNDAKIYWKSHKNRYKTYWKSHI